MTMNFNTGPYFDDFDPTNNFYRVLFKPGYAVQARELNQLQSILQHQVSSMGNHLFKKNSIVIPGGISLNNAADIVSVTGNLDETVLTTLVGKTITNATSFDYTDDSTLDGYITAVVLGYNAATSEVPAALYVKYFKTQDDGRKTFNQSEVLNTVDGTLLSFTVDSTIGSTVGKVATISAGTFYTKETFVDVAQQSVIVEVDKTVTTNCVIGLNINESIVTSDTDESLLDNANGSPNQYAPGADRYKITLTLARIDPTTTTNDEKFIKMMSIENNVITYINNKTQYAELMTTLARRTYDANGNFIVRGLDTSITTASDDNYIWANVTGGKAYLGGYEYEQLVTTPVAIEKPRDVAHQLQVTPTSTYTTGMTYFYVAGGSYLKEIPVENSLVQFLNAAPGTSSVSVIGYGIFKSMQYSFGDQNTDDVYKMYFEYVSLEKGYTLSDIGGIKAIVANEGAPVLHELRISGQTGLFTAGNTIKSTTISSQTGLMYNVVNNYAYVIKNTLNAVPNTAVVKDNTTGATATLSSTFVTNYTINSIPMIEVDKDTIKTLYNDDGDNITSYSIIRRDPFVVTTSGTLTVTLSGTDVFEEYSTSDYFAFIVTAGSEQIVDLTNLITITNNGQTYELTVPGGSVMIGNTVWVYSTVNKINVTEAAKTKVTLTAGAVIPTPSRSWMALGHQDITAITKIVDSKTVGISTASWATNVATVTTATDHGINVSDVVVVSGVLSTNNTGGAYDSGYNGKFVVTGKTSNTFTYALTVDPGTYSTSTSDIVSLPPNINADTDITSRFTFDSGNTAYISGTGMIKLNKGATPPQGQIAVQYSYYTVGTGNYISVDSYPHTTGDLTFIGDIGDVRDSQGDVIQARRYIDFRPRTSSYFFKNVGTIASGSHILVLRDLNVTYHATALVGKYVVGPGFLSGATISSVKFNAATGNSEITLGGSAAGANYSGTFYIGLNGSALSLVDTGAGAKAFDFPKDSTRLTYQYVKFLPKHAMVYINRISDLLKVEYKEITSKLDAAKLQRDEFKLPLAYLYMEPYTLDVRSVTLEKFENPVYQMLDIHNLRKRIDRTEYYAALSLNRDISAEIASAVSETVTTASRGIWSEDFVDAGRQDYYSDDFKCTVYDRTYVAPGTVTRTIPLEHDSNLNTSTWQKTGTAITLPYKEARAFGNVNASRFNNLNPFNVVNWSGKLTLNPSVDNWVDTTSVVSPTVNTTSSTSTAASSSTAQVSVVTPVVVPTPVVVTQPPVVVPAPPVVEIVREINNLRTSWGPDSAGGSHAITFDWKTNTGRTGRVNTDMHLSTAIASKGFNGDYARSLINRLYNDADVKSYLNAGTHFDQRPPSQW